MQSSRRKLLGVMAAGGAAALLSGRDEAQAGPDGRSGLVGAWRVAVSRPTGEGVVLLTFTSDGTFFRSGDTHPVLSVAHGAWVQMSDRTYDGSYVALRFNENRAHIGSQNTRIRILVGDDPDQFTAVAKVQTVALDGTIEATSESQLRGSRMKVESFDD